MVLRAVLVGAILFASSAHGQSVRDAPPPAQGGTPPATFGGDQKPLSVTDFVVAAVPAGAVRVGGAVRPPVQTKKVNPVYPQAAQLERVAGFVILEVIIGTDGKVREGRVLRSVAFLDEAAIEAVRQWEYTPTELDGKPVAVVMTVTVTFNMDVGIAEPPLTVFPWPAAQGAVRAGLGGTVDIPRQTKTARADFPDTPILRYKLVMCFSTVRTLRKSCSAISSLFFPSAISRNTSSSLPVNSYVFFNDRSSAFVLCIFFSRYLVFSISFSAPNR